MDEEPVRIGRNKGRAMQAQPQGRRKLFDRASKKVFLDWFAGTANLSWAARKAGVHYRTVLRHRMNDPVFRAEYDEAEAQSGPRLRAWLLQAREEAEAPAGEDGEDGEAAPGGDPAPVNMNTDQSIKMVSTLDAREAARERRSTSLGVSGAEGAGRGGGRPVTVASNQEVRDALVKALLAHGIRVRAEQCRRHGSRWWAPIWTMSPR